MPENTNLVESDSQCFAFREVVEERECFPSDVYSVTSKFYQPITEHWTNMCKKLGNLHTLNVSNTQHYKYWTVQPLNTGRLFVVRPRL